MTSRIVTVILLVLLGLLQYPLWFGKGGALRVSILENQLAQQRAENEAARMRNQQLEGDVRSLKEGVEAIEERARKDFNMIKDGEVFIELVQPSALVKSPVELAPPKNGQAETED
jgi:cell division protein FtsB